MDKSLILDREYLIDLALKIAKRADGIGCFCATHIGKMPTRDEVKMRIVQALESDDFETVAVHALFCLMLFQDKT